MVILTPNLVMNRIVSMCVYVSVHACVYMCVSESLCSPAHVSRCRRWVMQSVVRKGSLQTITVLLLSARAAGWGFLSDRRGVCLVVLLAGGILATASFCTHFLSLDNGVSRAWK